MASSSLEYDSSFDSIEDDTKKIKLAELRKQGFTQREMVIISGISQGQICKLLKKLDNKITPTKEPIDSGIKESKKSKKKKNNTPHSQTPQSRQGDKPGTPLKLTEEILETALVHALIDDPIKALNPALAFLDKKKSLSVEDGDTEQTEDQKKYYNEVLKNIYH